MGESDDHRADVVAYASPNTPLGPRTSAVKLLGIALAITTAAGLAVTCWKLLPGPNWSPETANRVKCGSNLRQIKVALDAFAETNSAHRYPEHLVDLLYADIDIVPAAFVCRSTGDAPADGLGPEAAAQFAAEAGHLSYIYLAAGREAVDDPDIILLYELPSNHDGDGGNVLFADGHVEWLDAARLLKLFAPGSPATRPSTRPSQSAQPPAEASVPPEERTTAAGRRGNYDYIRNVLGGIVLEYYEPTKRSWVPDTLGKAMADAKTKPAYRGDYYGDPVVYQVKSPSSFYFLSLGPNHQYDNGGGDDLKVEFNDPGGWVDFKQ